MLKIDITRQNLAAIVAIEGEIDLYSSPKLRETLLQLTGEQAPVIVLNLEKVSYTDSSGLATLIEGLQATGKYGGKFVLTSISKEVREVFQLSHLDKVFEIYNSTEEALQAAS